LLPSLLRIPKLVSAQETLALAATLTKLGTNAVSALVHRLVPK